MSAYQCWCDQKERLRDNLRAQGEGAGVTSLVRHALAQVEQNAMAQQPDDLLRQQMGILFSCFKTSLQMLEITVTTKVWVAQSHTGKPSRRPAALWLLAACAVQLVLGLFAYFNRQTLMWIALAASFVCTLVGWFVLRRIPAAAQPDDDQLKVVAKPDTEKLFQSIDAQMKAIDRFINDFAYLNEQNTLRGGAPDPGAIPALAELMQAVCECEGESGEEAALAAERLISGMGARVVSYSAEESRLFTILPSVSQTRTLLPALVSQKDGSLLYRGTAVVLQAASFADPNAVAAVTPVPTVMHADNSSTETGGE
jgi:hypothetical protein